MGLGILFGSHDPEVVTLTWGLEGAREIVGGIGGLGKFRGGGRAVRVKRLSPEPACLSGDYLLNTDFVSSVVEYRIAFFECCFDSSCDLWCVFTF